MTNVRLINFNTEFTKLEIEVSNTQAITEILNKFELDYTVNFKVEAGSKRITIHHLNQLGIGFIELFLIEIKKIVVLDEHWIKFVDNLRRAAINAASQLVDTGSLNRNIVRKLFNMPSAWITAVAKYLDTRSLAFVQQVALGTVRDEKSKRDNNLVRSILNPIWKECVKLHYPNAKLPESSRNCLTPPKEYNDSYFASNRSSTKRLLLYSTIVGDDKAQVMNFVTERDLTTPEYLHPGRQELCLIEIAKLYKHKHLLMAWWTRLVVPVYQLTSSTFNLTKVDIYSGETILEKAIIFNPDIIQNLLDSRADPCTGTSIYTAAKYNDITHLKLFIKKGVNLGEHALYVASKKGYTKVVSTLLKKRANPNSNTPLLNAAEYGHSACVKALLKAKADYNIPYSSGYTPLLYLSMSGEYEGVDCVLNAQAEDKLGVDNNPLLKTTPAPCHTPLHFSLLNKDEKIACRLLEAAVQNIQVLRACLTYINQRGESVIELAARFPTLQMLRKILALAAKHQIPVSIYQKLVNQVKNDLSILNLLDKIPNVDINLKKQIAEHKKQLQYITDNFSTLFSANRTAIGDREALMTNLRENLRNGGLC